MSLSDVRGDARDALHDEVRDWIHGGCFATRVVREDGDGIGGEGWDVHVRRGEDVAAPFAHLVELQALAFERQESLHRERRRAARRVDFVVVRHRGGAARWRRGVRGGAGGRGARVRAARSPRIGFIDARESARARPLAPSRGRAHLAPGRGDGECSTMGHPRSGSGRGPGGWDGGRGGRDAARGRGVVPRRSERSAEEERRRADPLDRAHQTPRYAAPGRSAFVRTSTAVQVAGNRGGASRSSGWLLVCHRVPIRVIAVTSVPEQHRLMR